MKHRGRPRIARRRIDEMIEEATVDCYGEDEQQGAFLVTLEWPGAPPDGAEWIEAYRVWLRGGG